MLDTKTWKNTMNSVGDWKIRWLRTLGWIQIKILIRSRKDVSKSDRCKWSEKSSFDSNSYFWSFDVIINKWNEMIEQVRNDENNISPRSPLYFGWDVKQLRFFENFISRGSKKFLLIFGVSSKWTQFRDFKRRLKGNMIHATMINVFQQQATLSRS